MAGSETPTPAPPAPAAAAAPTLAPAAPAEAPEAAPAAERAAPSPIAQPAGEARTGNPSAARQRPLTHGDARENLRSGQRRRPETPAQATEALAASGQAAAAVVPSTQDAPAPPAPAAAPNAPTGAPDPTGQAPAPAPTGAEPAATPSATATQGAAPSPTPSASTAPPPPADALPERYQSPEWTARYAADPLLYREVRSIWLQGDRDPVDRHDAILRRVQASDQRVAERYQTEAAPTDLLLAGRVDEARAAARRQQFEATRAREYAEGSSRILANALSVDHQDPDYLASGAGDTPEAQLASFAEYAVRRSPLGQTVIHERIVARDAEWQSRWDAREAQHAAALAAAEARLKDDGEAAALEREAQARAGVPAPPSAGPVGGAPGRGPTAGPLATRGSILGNLARGMGGNGQKWQGS